MEIRTLRSGCPVNYLLEIMGDKWSLLIIRDMLLDGKHSYGEFLNSAEGIATNILANRLLSLEEAGVITKRRDPTNRTKFIYSLSEKGIDLLPVFIEIIFWSEKYAPSGVPEDRKQLVALAKKDRDAFIKDAQQRLQGGDSSRIL